MLVGINYPWIDYGCDFGDPPSAWVVGDDLRAWRKAKRKQIEEDFRLFASQGLFAVRWFLLADGLNYGMGEFAPRKVGKDWVFEPLPEGHAFYGRLRDDFEFVLRVCSKNNLKLFPSLIDFGWCHQGMPVAGNPEIVKGGRYDLICSPSKREAFFERLLDPLIECAMQYKNSLYAWELINEPEWVVRGFWKRNANRNVTRGEMKEFIADGVRRIASKRLENEMSAFQTSVGFAHWETHDKWNAEELGLTLPQFHYYAQQNSELIANPHSAGRSCIIGEFATASGRTWPDLLKNNKDQTITNRLSCIEAKGYQACFMWSAKAKDSATRWTEEVQQEVVAYNSAKPGDSVTA